MAIQATRIQRRPTTSHGHRNYPPAFPIPPIDSSINADIAARVDAIGPAPNSANNAYLALNYNKQLVPISRPYSPPPNVRLAIDDGCSGQYLVGGARLPIWSNTWAVPSFHPTHNRVSIYCT